jgi:eukaryotic-like serine/threonine-protein kinase
MPRYREGCLLGRGGMGEVHLWHDAWLGREVAIKTLPPGRSLSAAARARFFREARVQGQLEHPAIVPVYDVGIDDNGREYFAMKRVSGRTLENAMAGSELSRARFLALLRQVCLAVDYAHARGVVHRDLKPRNVMIGDFGDVYVLDWGLAKLLEPGCSVEAGTDVGGHTLSGQLIGTPGYMAPEQISRADDVDERADVYALGAMLFEVLAGERLHHGETVAELLQSTRRLSGARPTERIPGLDVPPALDAICAVATAHDRELRKVGARDLANAIEACLDQSRACEPTNDCIFEAMGRPPRTRRARPARAESASGPRVLPFRLGGARFAVIIEEPSKGPDGISNAEREIVRLLRSGLSNAEIARIRGTSVRTVANQVSALMRKLGAGSRLELALLESDV